jgi:hypothetical protein
LFTKIKSDKHPFVLCGVAIACNQAGTEGVLINSRALSNRTVGSPTSFARKVGIKTMKKVLGIALAIATLGIGVSAEAKASDVSQQNSTVAASSAAQWQRDRWGRRRDDRRYDRRYNRQRTVTQSRLVRVGRRLYRETYLVTYYGNGRTNTRLISRTRVG